MNMEVIDDLNKNKFLRDNWRKILTEVGFKEERN